MSDGYQILNQAGTYFLTFTVVDWVDVFTRQSYRDKILESITYCRNIKGLQVWAYVIMSNHVHCIVSAKEENLSCVIRDFKRYTAMSILEMIKSGPESRSEWMCRRFEFAIKRGSHNERSMFWMRSNHAIELNTNKFIRQRLNYIHMNPVRAGWVDHAYEWRYSSMRNYCNMPALIEIDVMDINF